MRRVLIAGLTVVAGMAAAADRDLPKVGPHPAMPEVSVAFNNRITLDAKLTLDRGGDLATEVTKAVQLRFEVGFTADEGAKDTPVRFTCRISFVRADGSSSPVVREGPCYEGTLADAAGRRVEIGAPLLFRPGRDDPLGATGVLLVIRDEVSRKEKRIMPTYGWAFEP